MSAVGPAVLLFCSIGIAFGATATNQGYVCNSKEASSCANGLCDASNRTCLCHPGWFGQSCDVWSCLIPGICLNGGVCTGEGSACDCPPGFTGSRCQLLRNNTSSDQLTVMGPSSRGVAGLELLMRNLTSQTVAAIEELTSLVEDTVDKYFTCNKKWTVKGARRYHALQGVMTFSEAKKACEEICEHDTGSYLAFPRSLPELEQIYDVRDEMLGSGLLPYSTNIWVGIEYTGGSDGRSTPGTSQWETALGASANTTLWAPGDSSGTTPCTTPNSRNVYYRQCKRYTIISFHDKSGIYGSDSGSYAAICMKNAH